MKPVPGDKPETTDLAGRAGGAALNFDLRSLFLIVGFLALAIAALTWRDRSLSAALFVCGASAAGIVATLTRHRRFANVVIVVVCLWLVAVLVALAGTVWWG